MIMQLFSLLSSFTSLLFCLSLILLLDGVDGQYYTASVAGFVPFNLAINPPLNNTIEPVCVVDPSAVWTHNNITSMWSAGGGMNAILTTSNWAYYSTDGNTWYSFITAPSVSVNPAAPIIGRAGGGTLFMINATYPNYTLYFWNGAYADDVGLYGATVTSTPTSISAGSFQWVNTNVFPPQTLFRIAYASMPYQNYIIQAGGIDAAAETGSYQGTNEVWYSNNQGNTWKSPSTMVPFPPFQGGNMVALFDSRYVPGSGSTQNYSTLVLIIPYTSASQVWSSSDGGNTWTSMSSSAPWLVSKDSGYRRAGSATVDASNSIYYMGGSTLTADLYISNNKGATWNLIPISGNYAASYSSCLAVRYVNGNLNLVLYSGQIYTSLSTSGSPLSVPTPSVYAITFSLTSTSTPPSTTPLPVNYPGGVSPSAYYFNIVVNNSVLLNNYPYEICYWGILNTTNYAGFGDSVASLPYQLVTAVSGYRIFSNTTLYSAVSIIGLSYADVLTYYPNNYLYPTTSSHVDYYGLGFNFSSPIYYASPPPPNNFPPPFNTGSQAAFTFTQVCSSSYLIENTLIENPTPDTAAISTVFHITAVTTGSSNPYANSCPPTALPAPTPGGSSNVSLPVITRLLGENQPQVGSTGGSIVGAQNSLEFTMLGSSFTQPFYVFVYDALGNGAICAIDTSNSNTAAGIIAVFPNWPNGVPADAAISWTSVRVVQQSGSSNYYPGLLFVTLPFTGPYPPAIYNVTGSSCSPVSTSQLALYGPQAKQCAQGQTFTINGDFFNSSIAVTVNGQVCSSFNFISSTTLTCSTNQPVNANTGTAYIIQATQGGYLSNQLVGFYVTSSATMRNDTNHHSLWLCCITVVLLLTLL